MSYFWEEPLKVQERFKASEMEQGMLQFIREYLGAMTSSERDALIQNPESPMFNTMVEAYLKSMVGTRLNWSLIDPKTALYRMADEYLRKKP